MHPVERRLVASAGHDGSGKLPLAGSERDPARDRAKAAEDRNGDKILQDAQPARRIGRQVTGCIDGAACRICYRLSTPGVRPGNHAPQDSHHRARMHHDRIDATPKAVRLMKDAELAEHCSAVIVDLLAYKPVVFVEGVDAAERELNMTAGRRQTAPRAQMVSADNGFQNDCGFANVTPLHVDLQVGHGAQQL